MRRDVRPARSLHRWHRAAAKADTTEVVDSVRFRTATEKGCEVKKRTCRIRAPVTPLPVIEERAAEHFRLHGAATAERGARTMQPSPARSQARTISPRTLEAQESRQEREIGTV